MKLHKDIEKLPTTVLKVKGMMNLMEDYTYERRQTGAFDTEPRYHINRTLMLALRDGTASAPQGPREWELYSCQIASHSVAKKMTRMMNDIIKLVEMATSAEADELKKYYFG